LRKVLRCLLKEFNCRDSARVYPLPCHLHGFAVLFLKEKLAWNYPGHSSFWISRACIGRVPLPWLDPAFFAFGLKAPGPAA
jgi:hypothetical protein